MKAAKLSVASIAIRFILGRQNHQGSYSKPLEQRYPSFGKVGAYADIRVAGVDC